MSGSYLRIRKDQGGWAWYLVNSRGSVVHETPYRYGSRDRAIDAAYESDLYFVGR